MRWRFIDAIELLQPHATIVGRARSEFPDELFADHFPGFPVTPGVLCVEMAAQLAGMLIQATVFEQRGRWVLPMLASLERARFNTMVMPNTELRVRATLDQLRPDAAMCSATLERADDPSARAVLAVRMMFVFDLARDDAPLRSECPRRFAELGAPWTPRGSDTVD